MELPIIEQEQLTVLIEVRRKPYGIKDLTDLIDLFNSIHAPAMTVSVKQ